MQSETRLAYIKRINYVLDFIEKNLDADLSLDQMAERSHYSPYHFHRTFSTIIGEKLNEFVNRKRIERIAAILLTGVDKPIKELAYHYGFNSESSFSRSFKQYYGISPTRFKSEGKSVLSKIGIEPFTTEKYICSIDHINNWIEMNAQITIMELQEVMLAAIMHIGSPDNMGGMYQKLMKWGAEKDVLPGANFKAITIYHDNPHVTQSSKIRFSACITINKAIEAEGDIRPLTIPKGLYAIGSFEITAMEFPMAWKSMNTWVLDNDYRFRDGDYFELYHNDHHTHPEQKFIIDICIPLESSDHIKLDGNSKAASIADLPNVKKLVSQREERVDDRRLVMYMQELKAFFQKEYNPDFIVRNTYHGSMDYSYLPLTTEELRKQKLKFVIILNLKLMRFEICLSGQNKSIRKKYWELFKGSSWDKYHLAESIDDSLSIIDHVIVEKPDFDHVTSLTQQIERESLIFINEIRGILE